MQSKSSIAAAGFEIIIEAVAGDVHDDGAGHLSQERDFFTEKAFETDVGQADGVEHSGAGFDDARGFVAGRSSRVIDLVTNAPRRRRSMKSAYSKA